MVAHLAGMRAVRLVSCWAVPKVSHSVGSKVAVWVALSAALWAEHWAAGLVVWLALSLVELTGFSWAAPRAVRRVAELAAKMVVQLVDELVALWAGMWESD